MTKLNRLVRNATSSVVQTLISGLVLFFLYRYLIVQLGAEQFGLWSTILAGASLARFSDMGLTGSIIKFVARYRAMKDDFQAAESIQTSAISIALVTGLLVLALYPLLETMLQLVIPSNSISQALDILPWAILSLWLSSIGGVFQSGLDGCHRMDIRNPLMTAGNVIFLGATFWLVPHYGLTGLAIGQAIQSLLLMLAYWIALRRQLPCLPLLPRYWSKTKFKEMFAYAFNFQIISIAILFFEPTTKLLMSHYGGLQSAAFYEMANQFILKLRALLLAASQALVPAVAELQDTFPEKVGGLYTRAYRLLFFATIPFYAAILIALPLISTLWIGHIEPQFILFGIILVAGWGVNNLIAAAYFVNLGTGNIKANSITHVWMSILNLALCLLLGSQFGSIGVAIGTASALTFASIYLLLIMHKQYGIALFDIVPSEHYLLSLVVFCCVAISLLANSPATWMVGALNLGGYLLIVCIVMLRHPYKTKLICWLKNRDQVFP